MTLSFETTHTQHYPPLSHKTTDTEKDESNFQCNCLRYVLTPIQMRGPITSAYIRGMRWEGMHSNVWIWRLQISLQTTPEVPSCKHCALRASQLFVLFSFCSQSCMNLDDIYFTSESKHIWNYAKNIVKCHWKIKECKELFCSTAICAKLAVMNGIAAPSSKGHAKLTKRYHYVRKWTKIKNASVKCKNSPQNLVPWSCQKEPAAEKWQKTWTILLETRHELVAARFESSAENNLKIRLHFLERSILEKYRLHSNTKHKVIQQMSTRFETASIMSFSTQANSLEIDLPWRDSSQHTPGSPFVLFSADPLHPRVSFYPCFGRCGWKTIC